MRRLVLKPFWRLHVENWGIDFNEDGYYTGYEEFLSGHSIPYATEQEAMFAATVALSGGSWVQIEKYENE